MTELMVVVTIIGIAMVVIAPPVVKMWKRPGLDQAGNALAGSMRLCRQKAVWRRVPYRLTLDTNLRFFYSERQDSAGVWQLDPPDTTFIERGIDLSVRAGGSDSNLDLLFEGRGTVSATDTPATILFWNDRAETLAVQLVRTGRVRIARRG